MLTLHGLGGDYDEVFLPLHGAHQAQNAAVALAAVEAFFGVGSTRPARLDIDTVRDAFAAVTSPGRLEVVRAQPDRRARRRAQPGRRPATADGVARGVRLHPPGRRGRRRAPTRTYAGVLEAFEPIFAEVVVTQNSSFRAMDVDELAALAVEVFGADRVKVEPRLDDAIEAAITLAEEERRVRGRGRAGHRLGGHRRRGPAAAGPEVRSRCEPCAPAR